MANIEIMKKELINNIEKREWKGDIYTYPHSMAYRTLKQPLELKALWGETKEMNLYIHVPFCPGKCSYCGLFSLGCVDTQMISDYVTALMDEIEYYANIMGAVKIREIFIGGGTPNLLSFEQIEKLLKEIENKFQTPIEKMDICLECHPNYLSDNYIERIKKLGIGRISIGMQSFCTNELEISNRLYKVPIVVDIAKWCHKHGMPFNLDLIIGLPKQDEENMWYNIAQAVKLKPQSITLYPLTIVKGTPFETQVKKADIMSIRHICDLMPSIIGYLETNGFSCQSNVSFISKEYRAGRKFLKVGSLNIKYPCLGLGAGARSYADRLHYSMVYTTNQEEIRKIIEEYISTPIEERKYIGIPINEDENKRRYAMLSLIDGGIRLVDYAELFNTDPIEDFSDEFSVLEELGLIEKNDQFIRLSSNGVVYADIISRIFVSENVKRRYILSEAKSNIHNK